MNQSKRKSWGDSPEPSNGHHDAPKKRVKTGDAAYADAQTDGPKPQKGSEGKGLEHTKQEEPLERDAVETDEDNTSSAARKPDSVDMANPSPYQDGRSSESRGRGFSPHTRFTDQEKRSSDTPQRSRSPARSPDQDRQAQRYRRRDASPPSRDRRDSETYRRRPSLNQPSESKERLRRGAVNKEEEKKRGRRLFGGLISTLSQTTTNSQQKRRQEVEQRQQEKAAKQKTEDDLRRNERLAKLDKVRKTEQVRFDEQAVSIWLPWHVDVVPCDFR